MRTSLLPETEQFTDETDTQRSGDEKGTLQEETSVHNNTTIFTAVDMWNRNRQSRSASSFLRKWDLN